MEILQSGNNRHSLGLWAFANCTIEAIKEATKWNLNEHAVQRIRNATAGAIYSELLALPVANNAFLILKLASPYCHDEQMPIWRLCHSLNSLGQLGDKVTVSIDVVHA